MHNGGGCSNRALEYSDEFHAGTEITTCMNSQMTTQRIIVTGMSPVLFLDSFIFNSLQPVIYLYLATLKNPLIELCDYTLNAAFPAMP